MHLAIVVLAVLCSALAAPQGDVQSHWNNFKVAHKKDYDINEEKLRLAIFSDNLRKIEEHNARYEGGLETYQMGINQFSDMTDSEFEAYLGLSGPNPNLQLESQDEFSTVADYLPASVDYRKQNAVNPVKNQGGCGSCWAFSTVSSVESKYFLKKGVLPVLSEQNLVDCSKSYGNLGCNGGILGNAMTYMQEKGVESQSDYPYTGHEGSCHYQDFKVVLKISGYKVVTQHSELALQTAVAQEGPVAVSVDATKWQHYKSGIFKTTGAYALNHGVVVVGYGTEYGEDYWIVRNSWGSFWGEQGYIRVAMNAGNQVGISDYAVFPTI